MRPVSSISGMVTSLMVATVVCRAGADKWREHYARLCRRVHLLALPPNLLDHAGLTIPIVPTWLTVSSAFLHGGWLHLGFNMLMLLFCGRQVEGVVGGLLILLLYIVGAYAAALGVGARADSGPMIGASGAISAVVGAYALLFGNREVKAWGPFPASVVRMLWLGAGWTMLQFLSGAASSTGNMGIGHGGRERSCGCPCRWVYSRPVDDASAASYPFPLSQPTRLNSGPLNARGRHPLQG